jgi:serine/threonine protein kinase
LSDRADVESARLDQLLAHPMELGLFLRLAVGLSAAVGEVHRRGLIHKDIKPAHVLVNTATGQVSLTGFGIASRLRRERHSPETLELIAGTLPYMAPEQTGRMNRSIDSRTDLYSVGVTFYEMLTGSLPFTASDPMEWIHCHVARRAMPPADRLKDIPAVVSAIVMKLLAKTAEDRYQTAAGLPAPARSSRRNISVATGAGCRRLSGPRRSKGRVPRAWCSCSISPNAGGRSRSASTCDRRGPISPI